MDELDLTPFGYTPTESLVYGILLTRGPGTGYAIARSAGLARANAYSALEGLVMKGAARVEGDRPKRYRPEPPAALLARIAASQETAIERLRGALDAIAVPASPTLVEVATVRSALQLVGHDVARAASSVRLLAPADAYGLLGPALRRPLAAGVALDLWSLGPVTLDFVSVRPLEGAPGWPGQPLLAIVDDRSALVAAREDGDVRGHWSTAPTFVAAARLAFERLTAGA